MGSGVWPAAGRAGLMAVVLVIAAHPDDEILGGGATYAKHADAGDEVHALVVSEGASARYEDAMQSSLRAAAERSADVIGFSSINFLSLPDQRLDATPIIEVTQAIEQAVQHFRPAVVYTHSHVDVNTDHGVVARATWTACRPYSAPFVDRLLLFETPSSTEWAWPTTESAFLPSWFVDVSSTLQRKLDAMACYETELRAYPHPRSLLALRERAAHWGSISGTGLAEPFVLLRARS